MTVKLKGCIFFFLQKNISEIAKKCEMKLRRAWPSAPTRFLFMQVGLDLIVFLTCADDHHDVLEFVELDLKPFFTITQWVKGGGAENSFYLSTDGTIGLSVCLSVCLNPLRYLLILTLKSNSRDLWPLRHLIRVITRHNLTQKYLPMYLHTYLPTYLPTHPPTYLITHWATFDFWH